MSSAQPQLIGTLQWPLAAALFGAILTLYLAFPTKNSIYIGFGWVVYRLARLFVPGLAALTLLQALNSVLGAACVVLVYSIARELFADDFKAVLLELLFALSATWWKFATDADAYVPALLLLLTATRLLLLGRKPRPATIAVVHACAMLFHVLAAMLVAPAAIGIYLQDRSDRRKSVRNAVKYVAAALLLSTAAFYTCFQERKAASPSRPSSLLTPGTW